MENPERVREGGQRQIVKEIYGGHTTPMDRGGASTKAGGVSSCLSFANVGQYFAVKGEFISTREEASFTVCPGKSLTENPSASAASPLENKSRATE